MHMVSQPPSLLLAEDLNLWYGSFHAVRGITLEAKGGEILALLGANGAGKTSTLHVLTGILPPHSGSVRVAGHLLAGEGLEARRRMGYIPDRPDVYEGLSAREFIRFVCGLYGMRSREADQAAEPWLERFGLEAQADQLLGSFSFGMRQKAVIVATLAHDPEVLILDEPIVGLDPVSARVLMDTLRERARAGRAVLFSTHLLSIAEEVADRFALIHQGQIRAQGSLAEIKEMAGVGEGRLEDAFFRLTGSPLGAGVL